MRLNLIMNKNKKKLKILLNLNNQFFYSKLKTTNSCMHIKNFIIFDFLKKA